MKLNVLFPGIVLSFLGISSALLPDAALAQPMPVEVQPAQAVAAQPLVILRFNQRNINYEQQLYGAIAKAVAIKPGVMFDVVSVVPIYGNSQDEKRREVAEANFANVISSLNKMGVPSARLRTSSQNSTVAEVDEVHIFAR